MAAIFIGDCSRCGARQIAFDVLSNVIIGRRYGWAHVVELFMVCRACKLSSVMQAEQREVKTRFDFKNTNGLCKDGETLNHAIREVRLVTSTDRFVEQPPDDVPEDVTAIVKEGNTCLSAGCWNAAGSMYRLALDWVTNSRLPTEDQEGPNARVRRSLGLRTEWLFDNGLLPQDPRELADCIREDGNDGAHVGSLTKHEAEDLKDFCNELLRRLYTEPARVLAAKERREERRAGDAGDR